MKGTVFLVDDDEAVQRSLMLDTDADQLTFYPVDIR